MFESIRIGHGYDVHEFDPCRKLYLAGIYIEGSPGLKGHSDADVVIHALIDALLGACGLGDIGKWFPDDNIKYKNIRSVELLNEIVNVVKKNNYQLINTDITILAEVPKLEPHVEKMVSCLSNILHVDSQKINIKATTTEGLGFIGRKEGIAVHVVVLIYKNTLL